jgi:hypothetical protein
MLHNVQEGIKNHLAMIMLQIVHYGIKPHLAMIMLIGEEIMMMIIIDANMNLEKRQG